MIARILGAILADTYACHYCGRQYPTITEQRMCVDRCYRERYGQ